MTAPLVDVEDYPRGDIDLYKIRTARGKINCLQNDLNVLVKEITEGLEQHFTELKVESESSTANSSVTPETSSTQPSPPAAPEPVNKEPFAIINDVTVGSPSYEAGLRVKDEIIEFGTLTAKNFTNLPQFAEIAQHKLNQPVAVTVKRKRENGPNIIETIQLVPKKWSGRGYLGMVVNKL